MQSAAGAQNFEPQVEQKQFPGMKNLFYMEKRMHPDQMDNEIEALYDLIEDQEDSELEELDFDVWTVTPDQYDNLKDESQNRMILGVAIKNDDVSQALIDKILGLNS